MSDGAGAGNAGADSAGEPTRQSSAAYGGPIAAGARPSKAGNDLPPASVEALDEPGPAEELPTIPPAPGPQKAALRWATREDRTVTPAVLVPRTPPPRPGSAAPAPVLGGGNWAPGSAAPVGARGERRRRRGPLVWALAAVLLVAASAGAVVGLGTSALRGPSDVTARPARGDVVFEQLLAQSANAQYLVATAVAHACQESAPGAPARNSQFTELNRAVKLEYSVLGAVQVDTRELSTVPEGVLLLADLDAVAAAGLTIGRDYEGWLQDLQATGCYSAPTNDIHYRAAGVEVVAASGAEQRLAGTWDGIAARYNLRAWTAAQI